jgi:hypothetical protein
LQQSHPDGPYNLAYVDDRAAISKSAAISGARNLPI